MIMHNLIGAKIIRIFISADNQILAFATNKGIFKYVARGDCCSQSWFNDITGVEALLNATVQNIEKVDLPDVCKSLSEYIQAYGYKIKTDRGYADIVFRNREWLLRGGYLEEIHLPSIDDDKEITDDWIAS